MNGAAANKLKTCYSADGQNRTDELFYRSEKKPMVYLFFLFGNETVCQIIKLFGKTNFYHECDNCKWS